MAKTTPVASYSLTVRVRIANLPGMLGKVTSAIGEAGGDIGAVDIVEAGGQTMTRDVTFKSSDEAARPAHRGAGCSITISGVEGKTATVCTRPDDPLSPGVRAPARSNPLAGRFKPFNSQPPVIRVPVPSGAQRLPPSVDSSKLTCSTSGDAPPRSHWTRLVSGAVRFCVAGSFSMRAMRRRATPSTVVKRPAMTSFPSACNIVL